MTMTILTEPWADLCRRYPPLDDYLDGWGLDLGPDDQLGQVLSELEAQRWQDWGIDRPRFEEHLNAFLASLEERKEPGAAVRSVTIEGGRNKSGTPEGFRLTLRPGDVVAIVGPTGSGKSRLLADIEWMAQGDTPTGRVIRVNDELPDPNLRFSLEHKLVAQLTQNMNFVMDATVGEFLSLHAESRMVDPTTAVGPILDQANQLAGEPFTAETPVTSLSGGQSRALMIADAAFLSTSPIVLIDEIENAGIDKRRALDLLVRREKVVLIATHDPVLALTAHRRLVIRNGGVQAILETTADERAQLSSLERIDALVLDLRNRIRQGERIEKELFV